MAALLQPVMHRKRMLKLWQTYIRGHAAAAASGAQEQHGSCSLSCSKHTNGQAAAAVTVRKQRSSNGLEAMLARVVAAAMPRLPHFCICWLQAGLWCCCESCYARVAGVGCC
jgi:hypothetical protein